MLFEPTLKFYTVHLKPDAKEPAATAEFIADGFHFWAFAFSAIWALLHRCWLLLIALLAANGLFMVADEHWGIHPVTVIILQVLLQLWVGLQASDLLRWKFSRQGYVTVAVVSAENKARAQQRFFDHYLHRPHIPSPNKTTLPTERLIAEH